jgi:hypothetical protein
MNIDQRTCITQMNYKKINSKIELFSRFLSQKAKVDISSAQSFS